MSSGSLLRSRDSIALLVALLIVHAPLVVNDGLFGEDWLLFAVKPGYPIQADFLLHGAGHPFLYAYGALANLLGYPIAFMKALALAGIGTGAVNLKNLFVRLRVFSNKEAVILAFLVWSYAGYQNWATKLTATYIFSFALLCLGLNLLAIVASSDRRPIWLRLCSLIAIFCSFSLNSMIAIYFVGLCVVLFVEVSKAQSGRAILSIGIVKSLFVKSIRHFGDYIAVPFVYWISVSYVFPKVGPYRDYYLIKIPSLSEALSGLSDFWRWGFYRPIWEAINLARESHLAVGLALVVGFGLVALVAYPWNGDRPDTDCHARSATWPAIAGIVLFFSCASPYIAAGLGPNGHFYESRHLILFGLPLGLLMIAAYRFLHLTFRGSSVGLAFLVLMLSVNLCALWNGYFLQQARWLRQESMIDGLQRSYREPPAAVFNLVDGFLDYPGHTYFGITEITGALHLAWDGRPLFGYTGRNERTTVLQEIDKSMQMDGSPFRNMDLSGPQATINFVPKAPVLTNYRLSRSYYLCLIQLCDTHSVIDKLAEIAIRVGPIPNLEPPRS
jgi:hypothetical protein